jgi:hypothetical protein
MGKLTDWTNRSVNQLTGDTHGKRQNLAPLINKDSTPFIVFILYFAPAINVLVEETNRYYHHYLLTLDDGPFPLPDVTESIIFLLLEIIVQLGHDIQDSLADYWLMTEQFHTPYGKTLKHDWFFHIIQGYRRIRT